MKILVTGGAGFIGSHIVDLYRAEGHEVDVFDNLSTGSRENLPADIELHEADICDAALVDRVISEGGYDCINHHAAQLDVRVSVADPAFDAEQNIVGSLNLLQAAVSHGVSSCIFASSGGTVYGEQQTFPADESHPTMPISPYGVSKLSVEHYLHYYGRQFGLRSAVLRYTNVYGPRQRSHGEAGVVAIFCDRMLNGKQPTINGDGEQTRDYVYVTDVARANGAALHYLSECEEGTFNVCSDTETTVNELFGILNAGVGNAFEEQHGPAKPGEQRRSRCSWKRARDVLKWAPQVSLVDGLSTTMEYFRQRHVQADRI